MDNDVIISGILILRSITDCVETDIAVEPHTDCLFSEPPSICSEEVAASVLKDKIDEIAEQEILQVDFGGKGGD